MGFLNRSTWRKSSLKLALDYDMNGKTDVLCQATEMVDCLLWQFMELMTPYSAVFPLFHISHLYQ